MHEERTTAPETGSGLERWRAKKWRKSFWRIRCL